MAHTIPVVEFVGGPKDGDVTMGDAESLRSDFFVLCYNVVPWGPQPDPNETVPVHRYRLALRNGKLVYVYRGVE